MRIGFDLRLPAYQMGGISQYGLHLLPALARLDGDNEYLIFHHRRDGRSHLPQNSPNFQRRTVWTPCHHRLERWALATELLPLRLDLLHSPDFIPPAAGARRFVITVHDLNFLYHPQFLTSDSRRYYAGQIGWAVEKASLIAADSEHTRQDLIERLNVPPAKVHTIPLAANPLYQEDLPETAVADTLAHFNLPRGFVLFVGTLEPRKNLIMLLRAYHAARQAPGLDLPLVLVGRAGWLYEEVFATIAQLELTGSVVHLTAVADRQLAALYRAAAVLVQPSHYEGFGLPPLEAMHSGCPVIASHRASLPEVVGSGGLLLDPDDQDSWSEAIVRVVNESELRAEMVAAGRAQATQFSWSKTAAMTLALYREALQNGRRPTADS
jgi:glycosyltransferase involved in cell wall biosynthesis